MGTSKFIYQFINIQFKKIFLTVFLLAFFTFTYSQNNLCNLALPFCTGTTYNFPTSTSGGYGQLGPNYGCMATLQNPSWYYMQIANSGSITISISCVPGFNVINFACWGPFTSPTGPCTAQLTATCTGCPSNNLAAPGYYPQGNLVDCNTAPSSFTPSICTIPNGITGEYYLLMIGKYSSQPFNIVFSQTGGTGTTNCNLLAPPVTDNGPLCVGDTLIFNVSYPQLGATYNWSGPNSFTSTQMNPVINNVTLANAGIYTVTITVGSQSTVTTDTVTILAAPTPTVTNNSPVCTGDPISIVSTGGLGSTYLWSGPNGFTSTAAGIDINNATIINSGTYTVTVTGSNGCTAITTTNVIVYPPSTLTATNNGPVCSGSSVQLNTTGTSPFSWTGPNGFTSTLQNPVISPVTTYSTGVYTVTVLDANACTASASTTVTINPVPVVTATNNGPICIGSTLNLASSGGISYSWSGPGGFTSTLQNPTIPNATTSNTGTYSVTVVDSYGCTTSISTIVSVKVIPSTPVASNSSPICAGNTLNLYATSNAGSTYLWSGPGGYTSSLQNPVISNPTNSCAGTYTVTATLSVCSSAPATTTVTILPSPSSDFSLETPICQKDSSTIIYIGPSQPGVTYTWNFGGGTILSGSGTGPYEIQWSIAGTPTVTLTATNSTSPYCSSTTAHQLTVVPNSVIGCCVTPSPSAGQDASVCGLTYTMQGSLPGAGNLGIWSMISGPTSGTAVFTSNSSNASNVTVTIAGQYVFRWNEISGQCTAFDDVTISFVNQPSANAGLDNDTCGLTYILHAIPSYGTGTWSGNGTFTAPNSPTSYVTSTQGYGIVNFVWTEVNTMYGLTCVDYDTVAVHFYQIPSPDAGLDITVCGNSSFLHATIPATGNTGQWTQLSGAGTATFYNYHSNTSLVTVSLPGTYQFQWEEINGSCYATDVVNVTFVQIPTANAGIDAIICGKNYNLNASPSIGAGSWFGSGTFVPANNPNANVTVSSYGNYTFIWVETNTISGISCSDADSANVTFLEIPVPDAGYNSNACGQDANLNASTTYPGYWTGPAGALYSPSMTSHTANVTILPYTTLSHSETFYWHEVNGSCTGVDSVTITFQRSPHAEAGMNGSTCDTLYTLLSDTLGSAAIAGYWYSTTPGVLINSFNSINPTVSIHNIVPNIYGDSSYVDVWFHWGIQNSAYCISWDSMKVTFYQVPDAYAGANDSICGKQYNLNAVYSIDESFGQWSVITKPNTSALVNFVTSGSATSQVNVSDYGVYTFEWREWNKHNSQCESRDTVRIEFLDVPNINAGNDTSVCGKYVHLAATTSGGTGTWYAYNGGISWWNQPNGTNGPNYANNPITWARYSSENDTVMFIWQEYNSLCVARDSMYVYFASFQPAIDLVLNADSTNCGLTFDRLNAQQPAYGTGYWIDTVPNTHYFPSVPGPINPSPDSAVASYYGMHHFYWVTHNGACRDTSAMIPVRFIQIPIANAGINYWPGLYGSASEIKTDTTCGYTYYLNAVPSAGTGTWSCQDAANTWFNQYGQGVQTSSRYNDTVNTSILTYNTNPPYRQLIWIENNGGCTDADTLRLMFAPIPTASFTSTMPSCIGDSSVLIANTDVFNANNYGVIHFYWSLDNYAVFDSDTSHYINQDTVIVRWIGGDIHIVRLITENKYGCSSGIITDTIKEPAPFNPGYTVESATCHLLNGKIILDNENNTYKFTWDNSFPPAHIHDTIQENLQSMEYTIIVTGESVSPDAQPGTFCFDTLLIYVPDTGDVTAMFDTLAFADTVHTIDPYQVTFVNQSVNGRRYQWIFYDKDGNKISDSNEENPTYTFPEGIYKVVLVAESRDYCRDSLIYRYIYVRGKSMIEVPNVFTPNGDGMNDLFIVKNKTLKEFRCIILDRWGVKMYEWNNANNGWDGKLTNGAEAIPGVYFYIITGAGDDNVIYEFHGAFELLREKK